MTLLVVALGGNALLRRGEPAEAALQRRNVVAAASALARVAEDAQLVITHGNGPQIGLLALEGEAYDAVQPYPLDVLGAESQGMIGYLLAQALGSELDDPVVSVLTQVEVAPDDPAFLRPTKPIGPVYDERTARRLAAERGWTIAPDGPYYRRVVPSPEPQEILELEAIETLIGTGAIVVCAGGGGIPVVRRNGRLEGAEAVIDKDFTAALLAQRLDADRLVMLTDVPYVERDWGTPHARPIEVASPAMLRRLRFAAGSIGPKVEAACRFTEATGRSAAIGALSELESVARGESGTRVVARALAAIP